MISLTLLLSAVVPVFAEETSVSVNITGGSEASQNCVLSKSCYDPTTIDVPPKTIVTWTNIDSTAHTVTSGEPSENNTGVVFDSDMMAPQATYSFIFLSPGTYNYFCSIHPWMTGEVIVASPLTTNSSNNATTPEFGPTAILVFIISVFSAIFVAKNRLVFRF
ncbi:MAG: cupredoxin domain-containing protein [Thaumarchaeota archaeon]|nr:cupredoxin domain-containing protein [Nitrososphaerota archaeon]